MTRPATDGLPRRTASRGLARGSVLLALLAVGGCAQFGAAPGPPWPTDELQECEARFARVDAETALAGARDAQSARITGIPFLRSSRPLASFAAQASSPAARRAWLARAAELDRRARIVELRNAPLEASRLAALDTCRNVLVEALAQDQSRWNAVVFGARVADDYSGLQRALGLYPVSARVVLAGVRRLQAREQPQLLQLAPAAESGQRVYRVAAAIAAPPVAISRDALRIPRLTAHAQQALLRQHAPIVAIETVGDDDRPGAVVLRDGQPRIDTTRPTIYAETSFTRYRDETLLQLVYTVWFKARTAARPLDLLSGAFDGLTWRVTLARDGTVFAYDAMHACGCYHMVFPAPRLRRRPVSGGLEEPLWVPFPVPADWSSPPVLHLAAGTHYLTALSPASSEPAETLTLRDYDELRSLPDDDGRARSFFDEQGLVRSSARAERWILWPMGVRASGSMRQAGHHATAFVGRRHFDEARLFERYFDVDGGAP